MKKKEMQPAGPLPPPPRPPARFQDGGTINPVFVAHSQKQEAEMTRNPNNSQPVPPPPPPQTTQPQPGLVQDQDEEEVRVGDLMYAQFTRLNLIEQRLTMIDLALTDIIRLLSNLK